jgi:hypothetical protein
MQETPDFIGFASPHFAGVIPYTPADATSAMVPITTPRSFIRPAPENAVAVTLATT